MEQELAQMTALYTQAIGYLVNYSFQIVGALVVFFIGLLISRRIARFVLALCERKQLDITLSRFFASTARLTQVGIAGFGDNGIDLEARVWVQTRKFHEVRFAANQAIESALREVSIAIPFPQREVRVIGDYSVPTETPICRAP